MESTKAVLVKTKICTRCKKEKSVEYFYLYKKRNVYRSNCRDCYNAWSREYGKQSEVKERRNKKGDKWSQDNLKSWERYIPKESNCQVCDTALIFNGKNINKAIHFDHRIENCEIIESPCRWLLKHRFNSDTKKIWDSCNFGMLCGKCNRAIPTKNRQIWFEQLARYVCGEK